MCLQGGTPKKENPQLLYPHRLSLPKPGIIGSCCLWMSSHLSFSCTSSWQYQMYSSTSGNILAPSKGIQQHFFTESPRLYLISSESKRDCSALQGGCLYLFLSRERRMSGLYQKWLRLKWGSNLSTVSRMFPTRDSQKLSERVVISGSDTFYNPWGPFPNLPCDLSTCYCPLMLCTYWWHWPWKAHGLICEWYYCVWNDNRILGQRLEVAMWMWRLNKLETISKYQFVQAKVPEGFTKQYLHPGTAVTAS